jgi:hypothetical protein
MKNNSQKRVILGNGEKYALPNTYVGTPPGDTPRPYPPADAVRRVSRKLDIIIEKFDKLPKEVTPNDEIVTKLTLHPSFLAKSYYPTKIFNDYNLTSLGSKEVFIKPEVAANKEQQERAVSSSLYYVSGKKSAYEKLITDISKKAVDPDLSLELGRVEDISIFSGKEKCSISNDHSENLESIYEVVLHAGEDNQKTINDFYDFVESLVGDVFKEKTRSVNGLTFCFINIRAEKIEYLAEFVYVRVVRAASKIKFSDFFDGQNEQPSEYAEKVVGGNFDIKDLPSVAILDGGLFLKDFHSHPVRYFDLTSSADGPSSIFLHGELVTSAVIYGQIDDLLEDDHEIISVDHFKVYCENDESDIALVNVLDRISSVVKSKKYKIINISLGPCVPRPDDEPSLWTATLDELTSDGETLIIVAAGNGGEAADDVCEDLARIQPPADMLNGLSVGAANSMGKEWKRASYSSIGPGRRPGYIKPDAVFFGGESHDDGEKINLIGLSDYKQKSIHGTSFAAPLVTRLAALIDLKTQGKLTVPVIRALLIHSTENIGIDKKLCGWGRIEQNINNIIFCDDDRVTVIYKGVLESSSGVRAAIPWPKILTDEYAKVNLSATLCFYTDVDQKHTVSYTRSGIEIVFRPHSERFNFNKDLNRYSTEAKTRVLFNKKNILGNEQSLRKNSHKWETCYKVQDRFVTSSAKEPSFDIRYLTRDEGHPLTPREMKNLKSLSYALIVTISVDREMGLYSEIVNEYKLLAPLELQVNNELSV